MREFTYDNWLATLAKVYERAAFDATFRELCLTDPRAAVREVSEIELPHHFEFEFVTRRKDIFYSLLLPPLLIEADRADAEKQTIIWALSTHPTMGGHGPPAGTGPSFPPPGGS